MGARRYIDPSTLSLLAAMLASSAGWCYEDGAPPGHTGGFGEPDCSLCHAGDEEALPAGRLAIAGLPEAYAPGEQYELSIYLQHPELKSGGFQLAIRTQDGAPAGELRAVSPRTRIIGSEAEQAYLQHSRQGSEADTGGRISWVFRWRAPDTGEPVVLNIAANAANDDLSALGDYIYALEQRLAAKVGKSPVRRAPTGDIPNQ